MTKRVILSMFLLTILALVGMTLAKKNSSYTYSFSLPEMDLEKEHQDFTSLIQNHQINLKKNPANHVEMATLAQVFLARAKISDSSDYYQAAANYAYRSIKFAPLNNPVAFFVLAELALFERDFSRAERLAQMILMHSNSKSPEAYLVLARSQLGLGNLDKAMSFADELIELFPSEKAFSLRAAILAEQGRDQEAVMDFEEAIKLMEDDPTQASFTRAMYADYLIDRPNIRATSEKAKILLNEALRILPTSSYALGVAGELYGREKKYIEAIKFYKAAFRISKNLNFLFREAETYKQMGKNDLSMQLIDQIEILLREDLKNPRSLHANTLIKVLLFRGQSKDYAESLRLAYREKFLRPGVESLILYTWALEMNNQVLEARKNVRYLLAKNILSEDVLKRAGTIEEKLKNKNLADIYKNQILSGNEL